MSYNRVSASDICEGGPFERVLLDPESLRSELVRQGLHDARLREDSWVGVRSLTNDGRFSALFFASVGGGILPALLTRIYLPCWPTPGSAPEVILLLNEFNALGASYSLDCRTYEVILSHSLPCPEAYVERRVLTAEIEGLREECLRRGERIISLLQGRIPLAEAVRASL